MELMTKEIEKKLKETGYYPKVDDLLDATVIVKYFNPCGGATWLIVGGEQDGPNWILFGYATLDGCDWEWGSVFLHDLQVETEIKRLIEEEILNELVYVR